NRHFARELQRLLFVGESSLSHSPLVVRQEAQAFRQGVETSKGIVLAKQKPEFRSRGEESIRLVDTATYEIIRQDANERDLPSYGDLIPIQSTGGSVEPSKRTLSGRLL